MDGFPFVHSWDCSGVKWELNVDRRTAAGSAVNVEALGFAIEDTQRSLTSPTFQTDFSPLSCINLVLPDCFGGALS